MLVTSSRPWGASYQLLCRLISMHSILNWAIWINILCPALLIPYWNRSCQALLNTAFSQCFVATVSVFIMLWLLNPTPLPNSLSVMMFSGKPSLCQDTCRLWLFYRLGNKQTDYLLNFLDSRLVDGDLLLFLSWLLGRVQLQSLLWFCFLVRLSHKQQQRCASQFCIDCLIFLDHTHCLHQQNLLSESVYLSTAFFIKLGFQPRNEQGRINELLSVCHSFF